MPKSKINSTIISTLKQRHPRRWQSILRAVKSVETMDHKLSGEYLYYVETLTPVHTGAKTSELDFWVIEQNTGAGIYFHSCQGAIKAWKEI